MWEERSFPPLAAARGWILPKTHIPLAHIFLILYKKKHIILIIYKKFIICLSKENDQGK
jgi:hypothetical protein